MSKRTEIIDTIDSSTAADIAVVKKMDYGVSRGAAAYGDTEVPDMGAVREAVITAVFGNIIADVTAGDPQPLTINYGTLQWPNVIYRNADGSRYGGATDLDNGTEVVITGDADVSGNFADSFVVIVKA